MKRGSIKKYSAVLVLVALIVIASVFVVLKKTIFAGVDDTCTGADTNLIPAAKGDFETITAPALDASEYSDRATSDKSWYYAPNNASPQIKDKRLIIGSKDKDVKKIPARPYLYFELPHQLRKDKVYEFKVEFETAFGKDNAENINPRIGVIRNGEENSGSITTLKATDDNQLTQSVSYYSPLRQTIEQNGSTDPDYFFLNLANVSPVTGEALAGELKIKKIAVKEGCLSDFAKADPNLYKSIIVPYTYAPSTSATPISTFAYHRAIPWNFGENNRPIVATATPIPASSSNNFTLFSHDTDSLDVTYTPSQDEVIGQDAVLASAKEISTTAAKGEKKRVYFSVHNNSDISNLEVSTSDFVQGEVPPDEGVSPTPIIADPDPTPSPSPTPSTTATVTHTPIVTPTSTVTVITPVTPVPVETESVKIEKGWTTIGPQKAFDTSDFSSLGLSVFQMYGSSWKISNPGGENFYSGAPSGLYIYNPSDARTINANIADSSMVPATEHIKTGWNLLFNNSDSSIAAGKYMIKMQNGGVTQSASLYSLVNQGVAYNFAPVILSTEGSTANYSYVDLKNSGAVIPAKKAFWFYMWDNWPTAVSKTNNSSIAYAAEPAESGIVPTVAVNSIRYNAKQPKEQFTGTYSLVNEIVEPFAKMTNTDQDNLAKGRNESFMIEVTVPGNIVAGWYAANIAVTADGKTQTIPTKIRIRDFALENISAERIVFPPNSNRRWYDKDKCNAGTAPADVESGCADIYQAVDTEISRLLDAGFNGFEVAGYGDGATDIGNLGVLGALKFDKPDQPHKITGFTFSPAIKRLLSKAKDDPRITSKFLINYGMLPGALLRQNGYFDNTVRTGEMSDYTKQAILLGLPDALPVDNKDSLFHKPIYINDDKYYYPGYGPTNYPNDPKSRRPLQPLSSDPSNDQITDLKQQLLMVLDDINAQVTDLTGKPNFWRFYGVDEAGWGSGQLSVGKWMFDAIKAPDRNPENKYEIYMTGKLDTFKQTIDHGVPFDQYSLTGGITSEGSSLVSSSKLSSYGYGSYDYDNGNEIRNRFLSGFGAYQYGIKNSLFWKYIGGNFSDNQVDDFTRVGLTSTGRKFITEFFNNPSYRDSYDAYYGNSALVDALADKNKYQTVSALEFVGIEEANTDMQYIETLTKKYGGDAAAAAKVQAKIDTLPDDLKLPKIRRTLYGTNMTKEKLNKIRDLIADEIEK